MAILNKTNIFGGIKFKLFIYIFISVVTVLAFSSLSWAIDMQTLDDTPYFTKDPYWVSVDTPIPHYELTDSGPQNEFEFDDRPNFYIKFIYTGVNDFFEHTDHGELFWKYQGQENDWGHNESNGSFAGNGIVSGLYFNFPEWEAQRLPGEWTVNSIFSIDGIEKYNQTFSFTIKNPITVTPEPVSSMLFLLGGGALGVVSRRRKTHAINKKQSI